jgi:hypothetical protein
MIFGLLGLANLAQDDVLQFHRIQTLILMLHKPCLYLYITAALAPSSIMESDHKSH